ncbi:MAG TPA: hypothetical protein VFE35_11955 [Candidatus Cybelea sp.]|jgi:hypothetical protein|nr:hypothetical protein [Candidatus Cybelea sp.]
MNYVEWLRVRNWLKITAIVLGVFLVLAIVLRISVSRYMSPDAWVHESMMHPGVKVTHTTLPDGTQRTILDDPAESTRAIIDDRGYAGKHIVITEPSSRAQHESSHINVGSIQVFESHQGKMTTTVVDTNGAVPMLYYMAIADIVAILVATILAAPLAREVDGHLEIALTKPIPRARFALGAMGADVVGIIAASCLTVVAFYICQLLFESARLDFSGINSRAIAMGIACPLAWYAMLCALTTWFNRSYIAVLVSAIPGVIIVGILTIIHPNNVVALFVHDVAWGISRLIPFSYVSFAEPTSHGTINYEASAASSFGFRMAIQVMFFVVYSALAIWKWQRVEA